MAAGAKGVIYAALFGNGAIAVTKYAASVFTGSSAMLSEAIHSTVDTGNQVLLLFGLRRSGKKPSEEHPFGYGLQLYFWAFVVAIIIFGLGGGLSIWEGIEKIRNPHPIEHAWVNYIVLGLALLIEGGVWRVAFREFKKTKGRQTWIGAVRTSKDPMVFTVLFEDSAAMLGLGAALVGIFLAQTLDMPVLDGVASVIIGLILVVTASFLAYECQGLLTGEAVKPSIRRNLYEIAASADGVLCVNELLTMHFGPRNVLVAHSLDFRDDLAAGHVERTATWIEQRMKAAHPEVKRIFVEAQSRADHQRLSEPLPIDEDEPGR
jgi:cation diffusion facilitator family transporter